MFGSLLNSRGEDEEESLSPAEIALTQLYLVLHFLHGSHFLIWQAGHLWIDCCMLLQLGIMSKSLFLFMRCFGSDFFYCWLFLLLIISLMIISLMIVRCWLLFLLQIDLSVAPDKDIVLMFALSDVEQLNMLMVRVNSETQTRLPLLMFLFQAVASKSVFLDLMGLGANVALNKAANLKFMQDNVADLRRRYSGSSFSHFSKLIHCVLLSGQLVDVELTVGSVVGQYTLTQWLHQDLEPTSSLVVGELENLPRRWAPSQRAHGRGRRWAYHICTYSFLS